MTEPCVFCTPDENRTVIADNEYALAVLDQYPVTEGHALIIPFRHFDDFFDITPDEWLSVMQLLLKTRTILSMTDESITGFNMGVNAGAAAGQTIPHCHIHLIPRRDGDTEDPTGGVRGVIPAMQNYTNQPPPPQPEPLPEASSFAPRPAPSLFVPRPSSED